MCVCQAAVHARTSSISSMSMPVAAVLAVLMAVLMGMRQAAVHARSRSTLLGMLFNTTASCAPRSAFWGKARKHARGMPA